MADIPGDSGEGLDIRALVSGTDIIGVYPSGTFDVVTGSKAWTIDTIPTGADRNNPAYSFYPSGAGSVIGSIVQSIGANTYTQLFSYDAADFLVNIGSWVAS